MLALLYGEVAAMLALGSGAALKSEHPGLGRSGCQLSVVAGAHNRHCLLFALVGLRAIR